MAQQDISVAKTKKNAEQKPIVFIDTNIFLDFYRARNDAGLTLLAKIDSLHEIIISSCQVEMEFKKNRLKVINDSISLLKSPDFNLQAPAFLAEAKTVQIIRKRVDDVRKRISGLKSRLAKTMENPKTHDRIYQTTQRLFTNSSGLNLKKDSTDFQGCPTKGPTTLP